MKTNDNQYYIYLRATKQRIHCTKEQFDDYYRDINAYRRTQQNHGRCVCPPSKRLYCDMDCYSCPYHAPGDMSSLDSGLEDDDGEEMNWLDHLQEEMPDLQVPSPADYVSDALYMRQILDRLCEIMPQAIEIGRLREQGLRDTAIAGEIGIPRKTFTDRLKKAMGILQNEKYKGDALLQKKFTVDFLTKKQKVNEGEVPQYYMVVSHPAIIDAMDFDRVQAEIARRQRLGRSYSGSSIFASKLICGDCGGFYGKKVWHSTDAYRREVWRCNSKFKGEARYAPPPWTQTSFSGCSLRHTIS